MRLEQTVNEGARVSVTTAVLSGPVMTVVIGGGIETTTEVDVPPGAKVVKVTPPDVIVTGTLGEVIVTVDETTPPGTKFVIVWKALAIGRTIEEGETTYNSTWRH
jgi:hypothetical protein